MIFINDVYSWKNQSLIDYLNEGNIPITWYRFFKDNENEILSISDKIEFEKQKQDDYTIYPPINLTFRSFIPVDKMKVVILGQDPYHNKDSAVGLCFSVCPNNKINPSLKNIYKELKLEKYDVNDDGTLYHWA